MSLTSLAKCIWKIS